MNTRIALITIGLIAASLVSSPAHAVLQGRDLNGSVGSFEAYYDTVLDITWLANANYGAGSVYDDGGSTTDGRMTWAAANTWATNLIFYNSLTNQTYADWRLPTVKPVNGTSFNDTYSTNYNGSTDYGYNITSQRSEMAHLYHVTLGNPSIFTPAGALSDCSNGSNYCLNNIDPFTNLQAGPYWSGTELAPGGSAWYFNFSTGGQHFYYESISFYALAVSSGDIAAVPEAQTYALMLAGLGLIGWRARRRG